jgi:nitrogen fixation protein NifU and related proteins
MGDLNDLYQEVIVDHSKRPRNFGALDGATNDAEGYNPLCGDKVKIFLRLENDRVSDIRFQGSGCAISTASASILTETLKGKTRAEAEGLFSRFHKLVTEGELREEDQDELGKLAVFSGVSKYPARVKCAILAWHTLKAALASTHEQVSTE